ncbi:MAG: hypothetical protein JSU94_01025 [Phycisphaerales bacterium]|nr:MAG: hypothetical protein JSU94_01025 [Phycisphaerales bacterium]
MEKRIYGGILLLLLVAGIASAQDVRMEPFTIDWRDGSGSLVDLSFLLDAPAGRDGFVRVRDGRLVRPDGGRFRIWGVNVTAAACFPSKADAPAVAAHLARFGINCVRFHFLDSNWSRSLFARGRDDTRELDAASLDRLDYFIAELKKRGIYSNINLNVGRVYRKGDGVKDHEYIGFGKALNYFDERIMMLHKEYAQQLLTHKNPYTGSEYRSEPAVAIVELVNENSIVESWFADRLLGKNTKKNPGTWTDITAWYAGRLTEKYNSWLKKRLLGDELERFRETAGAGPGEPVPRLTAKEFGRAHEKRFHTEAAFYMELEGNYFREMYRYLKEDIGVRALVAGTSDHNHYKSGYPLLVSTSRLDVVDGHVYWQHPSYFTDGKTGRRSFSIRNTPMVNDPFNSTVVQLSRSAVAGKPYTVSETNHPFPSEYACEGIGILAAYSSFHDWDGIFFYTFEHKDPGGWVKKMPGHFDICPDPVRMTNLAACAVMFLRADVRAAVETVARSYTIKQIYESIRMPSSERPYFTPGFSPALPLVHTTRIASFSGESGPYERAAEESPVVCDTKELSWCHGPKGRGLVTIETERSQALIGFVRDNQRSLENVSAEVENEFCSVILTSLDGRAISASGRLLLAATARSANTGMKWNDKRTSLVDWGSEPSLIEPVRGLVTLRNLEPAKNIDVVALNGTGKPLEEPVDLQKGLGGWRIRIGEPPTTWYLIRVER